MVSVIMITYGHEKFIKEAIEGVLMQICDFKVELIVADDKSPDNTEAIVLELIKNHKNGHWVNYTKHDINKGMQPNFIWAYEQCKGKYIAICEGDDYWTDPLKLQKQVDFLEENEGYSTCAHDVNTIYDKSWKGNKSIRFNKAIDNASFVDVIDNHFLPTNSLLFRKDNTKGIKRIMYSENMISGDIPLTYVLASHGKIKYIFEEMAVKRINGGGVTASKKRKEKVIFFRYELNFLINEYTENKYIDILKPKIIYLYPRAIKSALKKGNLKIALKYTFWFLQLVIKS